MLDDECDRDSFSHSPKSMTRKRSFSLVYASSSREQHRSNINLWIHLPLILEMLGVCADLGRLLSVCKAFRKVGGRILLKRKAVVVCNAYSLKQDCIETIAIDVLTRQCWIMPSLSGPVSATFSPNENLLVMSRGTVHIYDGQEDSWKVHRALNEARNHVSAMPVPSQEKPALSKSTSSECRESQISLIEKPSHAFPCKRCPCEMAYAQAENSDLIVAGGYDGASTLNSVWRYSFQESRWSGQTPLREHRMQAAGAIIRAKCGTQGKEMFVVIGGKSREEVLLDSCEAFDNEANAWKELPRLPYPAEISSCAEYRQTIVVAPISSCPISCAYNIWRLDISGGKWLEIASLSSLCPAGNAISAPKLINISGVLMAFQCQEPGQTVINEYNEEQNVWKQMSFSVPGLVGDDALLQVVPLESLIVPCGGFHDQHSSPRLQRRRIL